MTEMRRNHPSSPPIVLVHGAGGGAWEWSIWMRVFEARGFCVHAPDLMLSPAGLAATTFNDYRGQVLAWCRQASEQDPRPPILIGASLGGLLALSAAVEVAASALVLINPMPPDGVGDQNQAASWPPVIPWARERSLSGTRRAMPDADDAARLFAYRHWRDESGPALEQASRGIGIALPDCPVLVFASSDDLEVPPQVSRQLAVRLGADYSYLPQSSHVGPLLGSRAAIVAEQAVTWLSNAIRSPTKISLHP
jgi:pimeloyl-ACP methyl ester carboxylesterase